MKRLLLLSAFLLTACVAPPAQAVYPTQTPDPIQAYVDANASKGTAVAAIATAEYFSMQLTATVETRNQVATQQEFSLQSTQQAASILATERAWNATSTADSIHATGTASAVAQQAIWTQRAMDITATADTASVQAYATQQYSIARNEELALQRKELMNKVAAVVPWSIGVGTFVVMVIVFIRWSRVRSHPTRPARRCTTSARCRGWRDIRRRPPPHLHWRTATRGHQTAAQVLSQRSYPNHRARSNAGSRHTRTARHKQKTSEQQAGRGRTNY